MINTLLGFIGSCFILAIFIIVILIFIDKYLRVKLLLLLTPWQNVGEFEPSNDLKTKGVYLWQKRKFFIWKTVYVGQSVNIFNRYKQHISGKGCPEIYIDYQKNPYKLRFKAISLQKSHYSNLDALEKRLIIKYNTVRHGYNKTAGNGRHRY